MGEKELVWRVVNFVWFDDVKFGPSFYMIRSKKDEDSSVGLCRNKEAIKEHTTEVQINHKRKADPDQPIHCNKTTNKEGLQITYISSL